jgi:hypothetical protein
MSQHKLNFAASRLVNPPGAAPVLTEAQVLAGLELKVRAPQDFVPAIISCDLISATRGIRSFPSLRLALSTDPRPCLIDVLGRALGGVPRRGDRTGGYRAIRGDRESPLPFPSLPHTPFFLTHSPCLSLTALRGLLRLPRDEHAHHEHSLLERGPGDGAHVLLRGGHPRVRAASDPGRRAPLAAGDERRGGARGGAYARADTRAGESGHYRLNWFWEKRTTQRFGMYLYVVVLVLVR